MPVTPRIDSRRTARQKLNLKRFRLLGRKQQERYSWMIITLVFCAFNMRLTDELHSTGYLEIEVMLQAPIRGLMCYDINQLKINYPE